MPFEPSKPSTPKNKFNPLNPSTPKKPVEIPQQEVKQEPSTTEVIRDKVGDAAEFVGDKVGDVADAVVGGYTSISKDLLYTKDTGAEYLSKKTGKSLDDIFNSTEGITRAMREAVPVDSLKDADLFVRDIDDSILWKSKNVRNAVLKELGYPQDFIDKQKYYDNPVPTSTEEALQDTSLDVIVPSAFKTVVKSASAMGVGLLRNKNMREHLDKVYKNPEAYDEASNLIKFIEDHGLTFPNAMLSGTIYSDVENYMHRENLFANRDLVNSVRFMQTDGTDLIMKVLNHLKTKDIDPANITDYKDVNKAGSIIAEEVRVFRANLKKREFDAWSATKPLMEEDKSLHKVVDLFSDIKKSMAKKGVPPESIAAVARVLNRFKSPFADDTRKLNLLRTQFSQGTIDIKKLRKQQRDAFKAGDNKLAGRLEGQIAKKREALSNNTAKQKELTDIRYMTFEDLHNTVKLINRKLYKPGESISMKDYDELRGLMIAKDALMQYSEKLAINPKLKELLTKAKDITQERAYLFGAKDTGGEKIMLARYLEIGDYYRAADYIKGNNGLENVEYLGKVLGKKSDGYATALKMHYLDKLGLTKDKIHTVMKRREGEDFPEIDFDAMGANLTKLSDKDFSVLSTVYSKKDVLDMKSIRNILNKYRRFEKVLGLSDKTEDKVKPIARGITKGKMDYLRNSEGIRDSTYRLGKLTKDATSYYIKKLMAEITKNKPYLNSLTGAIHGQALYLAGEEPENISLEDALTATILGAVGGYQMGRFTRSLMEGDAKKWIRYIKSDKFRPPNKAELRSARRLEKYIEMTDESNSIKSLESKLQ